jgi:hypothetical protein
MQSRITGTEVAQILSDCTDSWIEPKPAAVTEGKLI